MNRKNIAWVIVNNEHQPIFSDNRYWIFSTKKAAKEWINKKNHLRPRIIVKTMWEGKRRDKLQLKEKYL